MARKSNEMGWCQGFFFFPCHIGFKGTLFSDKPNCSDGAVEGSSCMARSHTPSKLGGSWPQKWSNEAWESGFHVVTNGSQAWICYFGVRGFQKNKTSSLNRFPSHGGFPIGKISQITDQTKPSKVTQNFKLLEMGMSENVVCLNPMVNDQFPY